MSQVLAHIGAVLTIVLFVIGIGCAAALSLLTFCLGETPPVELEHYD
jgi:hypothetical protein